MAGENDVHDEELNQFREEYQEIMEFYDDNSQFLSLMNILRETEGTFHMNRRLMQKIIDSSWVEAIERGLLHLDNVLRNPRRTLEDVEEIVPIALSRKTTIESVKHLAQHTDLIQSVDKRTGKITPSKILNVHREETLMTYENKFINTLIDRLYSFITMRYEKLVSVSKDGEIFTLGFNTEIDDRSGGKLKIEVHLENERSLETHDRSGYTVWQRVEKIKKAIEGYKGSELCQTLGNTFIRPPVMRTNAIMKNVDLRACLALWQYIESYDKIGYEINIENSAIQPKDDFIKDFYELVGLHMLLFRASVSPEQDLMEIRSGEVIAPKIIKKFDDEVGSRFDAEAEGVAGYISQTGEMRLKAAIPENTDLIVSQIERVIQIEYAYQEEKRARELAEQRAAEARERQRLEEARIEAERQAELARLEEERAEQERRVQEMLEQKRREQEEAERERERQEQERLALLEEKRKQEEAEKARLAEEQRQRDLEKAAELERIRIRQEKQMVISELGEAEGVEQKKDIQEQPFTETIPEVQEDPAAVAARNKREQQQREKERAENERAQRLKAERQHFENKSFQEIRREYSKNPFWMLVRLIRYILAMVFGIIPEDTDRPDFKERRRLILEKKQAKQQAQETRNRMEVYYKKYAQTFKYRILRHIQDYKFKRKRKKEMQSKPRPVYKSKLTPEQQLEVQQQMRSLYKRYHVSLYERLRRWFRSEIKRLKAWRQEIDASDRKLYKRIINIILAILIGIAVCFSLYVAICTIAGRPVNVFGYSVLKVETGSMEPTLHVGDFIIAKTCDTGTLQEGDIISYYSKQPDIQGMLITHRIQTVCDDGTFITIGDANVVSDSLPVTPDSILGVYVRKSEFYHWLGSFTDMNKLLLLLGLIPLSLISIYELFTLIKVGKQVHEESKEYSAEKAKENYERRMREAIEAEKKRLAEENYRPEDDKPEDNKPEDDKEDES